MVDRIKGGPKTGAGLAHQPVQRLYVHDYDGPLRNPRTGLPDYRLPFQMVHAINRGKTAWILNTGRDAAHTEFYLLYPQLIQTATHPDLTQRTIAICEKGAVTVSPTNQWGIFDTVVYEEFVVPQDLREVIKERLFNTPEFAEVVYEEPKLAMITYGARSDVPYNQFTNVQPGIVSVVQQAISELGYDNRVDLDKTMSAVDIQRKGTGKGLGFELGLRELERRGVEFSPDSEVVGFGDSSSDPEMIMRAKQLGFESVVYIHVGEGEIGDQPFPVILPLETNTAGTGDVLFQFEGVGTDLIINRAEEYANRGDVAGVMKLEELDFSQGIDPRIKQRILAQALINQARAHLQRGEIILAEEAKRNAEDIILKLQTGRIRDLWEAYV